MEPKRSLTKAQIRRFNEVVFAHYDTAGRHHLPWRKTHNPYRILVSEIMLQQTQVDRVIPKYRQFLKRFPNVVALAKAPLGEVLQQWQGLGYNRRAKLLHEAAKTVVAKYMGRFPKLYTELVKLPGVGPYTAGAVMAFAYNQPVVLIETNVRTVFLHHFFADITNVPEREILALVEQTLPRERAREWYAALMDYGAHLKRTHGNANRRSAVYKRQSTFKGSNRQIRGAIVRVLIAAAKFCTQKEIERKLVEYDVARVATQLVKLVAEGMVTERNGRYAILTT